MQSFSFQVKKILISFTSIWAAIVIIIIAFGPTILSTGWGNDILVRTINKRIPGILAAKRISLSWFGAQRAEELSLANPAGEMVFSAESLEINTSLFALVTKGPNLGKTNSSSITVSLKKGPSGKTALEESLGWTALSNHRGISLKEINATIKGNISNGVLQLESPAKIGFQVTPEFLSTLDVECQLHKPVEAVLDIQQLHLPLSQISEDFVLQAEARLTDATLSFEKKSQQTIQTQNILARIEAPENSDVMTLHLEGIISQNKQPIKIKADAKIQKPQNLAQVDLDKSELEIALEHVLSSAIDNLFSLEGTIENSLGKDFSLHLRTSSGDPQQLMLNLVSDRVDAPNIFLKVDQPLRINKDFFNKRYSGTLSVENFRVKNAPEGHAIQSLKIVWSTEGGLKASFSGQTDDGAGKFEGKISLKKKETFQFAVQGKRIPIEFLEFITGRNELQPLFGNLAGLDLSINVNGGRGPVSLDLKGEQGSLHLRSYYSGDTITLLDPFVLETQATPQLGKRVLGKFSPVFTELSSANNSFKLTIHPEKFSFPLARFNINHLVIGNAVAEMGKVQFYNSGEVKKLLNILGSVRSKQISAWSTPLYASMKNGILTLYRVDMLILDRYPIATWGTIDFPNDRIDMTIGITGRAIANAKNLEKVNSDIMVQVPYKGHPIKKAHIDIPTAITRIGAVVAKSSSIPEAIVLGSVFELANGKQNQIPAPTTTPFPWKEDDISSKVEKQSGQRKKDPLKKIKEYVPKFKILEELLH